MSASDEAVPATGDEAPQFLYSRGRDTFDNYPEQRSTATLREFVHQTISDRQQRKGQGFICGPLNSDGRRCAEGAIPRNWLPTDCDGIAPAVHADFRLYMSAYQGFGWATASSTDELFRERDIIILSRAVTRAESIAIGRVLMRDIAARFGDAVKIDPSTFRPEQPCFLPVGSVRPFYFTGEPLDVDRVLADVPPEAAPGTSEGTGVEQWIESLTSGANVHEGALRVVGRMVAKGLDAAAIRTWFEGVATLVEKARGEKRAHELLGRELDRMIDGAIVKYREPEAGGEQDAKPLRVVRIDRKSVV